MSLIPVKSTKSANATNPELLIKRGLARRAQRVSGDELRTLKTCFFDIEATSLTANFGLLLCASIKPQGEKVKVFRLDESPNYKEAPWDDSWLCRQIRDELEKYMIVVHYFGDYYDIPFMDSRLLSHDLKPINKQNMCFIDMWRACKSNLKLTSNRLAALIEFLNTKTHKTPLNGHLWIRAMCGDRKSMDQIVIHNRKDVESLEEVTQRMARFFKLQYKFTKNSF